MTISGVSSPQEMSQRRQDFIEWSREAPYNIFANNEGETMELQARRRGNKAYALRQRKRFDRTLERLGQERYSVVSNVNGTRRPSRALTQDLMLTFTVPHDKYSIDDANLCISYFVKKMRTYLRRIFGSKFGTITSYESSKSGFPHPHMIIRFDKYYTMFLHRSKTNNKLTWRLKDRNMVNAIKTAWDSITGGAFIDIQGIVNTDGDDLNTAFRYAFKYLTKAIVGEDWESDNVTALNTLSNNKAFNRGTVYISSAFVERIPNPSLSRLDIICTKLQQANNRFYALKRKLKSNPKLFPSVKAKFIRLIHVITVLKACLPPPTWHFVDSLTALEVRIRDGMRSLSSLSIDKLLDNYLI